MPYFLSPALARFRDEINARWPSRSKVSDGWIGDASHAARYSSHNPLWSASGRWSGVVRAIDVTNDSEEMRLAVVKAAVGHPACWYVISKGVIYSRTYGWVPRRYTGSNPHNSHVHISLSENSVAWDSAVPWLPKPAEQPAPRQIVKVQPRAVSLKVVRNQFMRAAGLMDGKPAPRNAVRRVQRSLNATVGARLSVDGIAGERTLNAWGQHERKVGKVGRPRIPDAKSLAALAQGRFRVVA